MINGSYSIVEETEDHRGPTVSRLGLACPASISRILFVSQPVFPVDSNLKLLSVSSHLVT
jgi:hypothetical protein